MFRQMVSGEAWIRISLETVRVSRGGLRRASAGPMRIGRVRSKRGLCGSQHAVCGRSLRR